MILLRIYKLSFISFILFFTSILFVSLFLAQQVNAQTPTPVWSCETPFFLNNTCQGLPDSTNYTCVTFDASSVCKQVSVNMSSWTSCINCTNLGQTCDRSPQRCITVSAPTATPTPQCNYFNLPDGCSSTTQFCSTSTNTCVSCPVGTANCNQSQGCETNTASDRNNCGGCGITCSSSQNCVNGSCQTATSSPTPTTPPSPSDCNNAGGTCRSSCFSSESSIFSNQCNIQGTICCVPGTPTPTPTTAPTPTTGINDCTNNIPSGICRQACQSGETSIQGKQQCLGTLCCVPSTPTPTPGCKLSGSCTLNTECCSLFCEPNFKTCQPVTPTPTGGAYTCSKVLFTGTTDCSGSYDSFTNYCSPTDETIGCIQSTATDSYYISCLDCSPTTCDSNANKCSPLTSPTSIPGALQCSFSPGGKCAQVMTAIGPIDVDPKAFVTRIMSILLGLAGGIAVLLIIIAGYRLMVSRDNPEAVQETRSRILAAIIGLVFVILSLVILEAIGVDILRIPGFT